MSVLFTPKKIGNVEIKNRFVHSATYECMADTAGNVTDKIIKRYSKIAKGGTGLIIPGYFYISPEGRAAKYQIGIQNDDKIEGLKTLVNSVHDNGSKIVFQLMHSGRQTSKEIIGQIPIAPSKGGMDYIYMSRPNEISKDQIQKVIKAFGDAARRAKEARADGVQIHAAHGYLINQFLSPFFNKRKDNWGDSDENKFRILREVVYEIRKNISDNMALMVKLNTQDFTPQKGITLELAKKYSEWLAALNIDALEVSCGTLSYSMFNMVRGSVPTNEMIVSLQWWKKLLGKMMFKRLEQKFDLEEGYNQEAAELIKPVLGDIPLILVGGLRRKEHMENIIDNNYANFISMSRPFIREPSIVNRIKSGKTQIVSCKSCNKCIAAVANHMPVYCYLNGFPKN